MATVKSLDESIHKSIGELFSAEPVKEDPAKEDGKKIEAKAEGTPKEGEAVAKSDPAKEGEVKAKEGETKAEGESATVAKSDPVKEGEAKSDEKIEISKEDFSLLEKVKKEKEAEGVAKKEDETKEVFKKALAEHSKERDERLDKVEKSLSDLARFFKDLVIRPKSETQAILKSLAPVEKHGKESNPGSKRITRKEAEATAFELVKGGKLDNDHYMELCSTQRISDSGARHTLENELNKR